MKEDLEKKAEEFRKSHGIESNPIMTSSSHFMVDIYKILAANGTLLADDTNQAFTQLFMGRFRNLFTDETKDFALAYNFALHPLDEIQNDLEEMGIVIPIKTKVKTLQDGQEVEITKFEEQPINFEVTILKDFIDEWLRKRVPANRKRVKEFIELITGQSMRELMMRQPQTEPREPLTRGRII